MLLLLWLWLWLRLWLFSRPLLLRIALTLLSRQALPPMYFLPGSTLEWLYAPPMYIREALPPVYLAVCTSPQKLARGLDAVTPSNPRHKRMGHCLRGRCQAAAHS